MAGYPKGPNRPCYWEEVCVCVCPRLTVSVSTSLSVPLPLSSLLLLPPLSAIITAGVGCSEGALWMVSVSEAS